MIMRQVSAQVVFCRGQAIYITLDTLWCLFWCMFDPKSCAFGCRVLQQDRERQTPKYILKINMLFSFVQPNATTRRDAR